MRPAYLLASSLLNVAVFPSVATADNVLKTSSVTQCQDDSSIRVNQAFVQYEESKKEVTFNVSGTSTREQKVTASLVVTAYGKTVFERDFDPCDSSTSVAQLCPVPAGTFAADSSLPIPEEYLDQIPSITFSVPDLIADAVLKLKAVDTGDQVACFAVSLSNGKTLAQEAITYAAAGIAGFALLLSSVTAALTAGDPGATTMSPTFTELVWWFQSISFNGMLSVDYPPVYRAFTQRFGFSVGLIPWPSLQKSIDKLRGATGGDLTTESYARLSSSSNSSSNVSPSRLGRRAAETWSTYLLPRASDGNATAISNSTSTSGLRQYFEEMKVPPANAFMTVLLVFLIAVAAIVVGILLFKVILEAWALWRGFPKNLTSFRKNYWMVILRTIANFMFLIYGIWTLYCIFQLIHGDSWTAKLLAGVTFGIFTIVLSLYAWRITTIVKRFKRAGDESGIYNNKTVWTRYRVFYEDFRAGYWWFFIPMIFYMFAKGVILAVGTGNGLAQAVGHLAVEVILLLLLLWSRPYNTTSGKWINLVIQTVRVISVCCVLVFVEQLGLAQVIKSTTGIVLASVQAGLTALLALLIGINSLITCIRQNPHRRRRKDLERRKTMYNEPAMAPDYTRESFLGPTIREVERGSGPLRKSWTSVKGTSVKETRAADANQPFLGSGYPGHYPDTSYQRS